MLTFADLNETRHVAYLHKADEFFQGLQTSVSAGRWSAAALCAVHLVTCSINALTCHYLQRPAVIADDSNPTALLDKLHLKGTRSKIKSALDILAFKWQVERGTIPITKKQSLQMAKTAERFYTWAKEQLPR